MDDSTKIRDFMAFMAQKMNKTPDDVEQFTKKLEENWINTVGDLKLMDDTTWQQIGMPVGLVNQIKKVLQESGGGQPQAQPQVQANIFMGNSQIQNTGGAPTYESTVKKVRMQLASRGARTIRGIQRTFKQIDSYDGNKRVDAEEMHIGLNEAGCNVSLQEVQLLMAKWDEDCNGTLNFDEFLKGLRGGLSPNRQAVVDAAWNKIDVDGSGQINVDDLHQAGYSAQMHPKVQSGQFTEDQVFQMFLEAFGDKDGDGNISKDEWNDYYGGISSSFDSDAEFVQSISNAWKL